MLMPCLTQVRCQVPQKAQGAVNSWGFKCVPVTLSSMSLRLQQLQPLLELPRCHVPMLDFVPTAVAELRLVAGPHCQQSRWCRTHREEGRGCARSVRAWWWSAG